MSKELVKYPQTDHCPVWSRLCILISQRRSGASDVRISDVLYAKQAQYHGLQAVDTDRHSVTRSTETGWAGYPTSDRGVDLYYLITGYRWNRRNTTPFTGGYARSQRQFPNGFVPNRRICACRRTGYDPSVAERPKTGGSSVRPHWKQSGPHVGIKQQAPGEHSQRK